MNPQTNIRDPILGMNRTARCIQICQRQRALLMKTLHLLLPAILAGISLFLTNDAQAQAARIFLDGDFGEWFNLDPAHTDASGDTQAGSIDFERLWIANDQQFLFLRFELGVETLIQEANEIVLYLDTDDDPATGQPIHGIGAELAWTFGQRTGVFTVGPVSRQISHAPLGIVTAPTVSATAFEVAFERDALPDGVHRLFESHTFRLVLDDEAGPDRLPDAPGGITYTFSEQEPLDLLAPVLLQKQNDADVRVLSYNVERDAFFIQSRNPSYNRLLQAINPEIIGFQEILNHSAAETVALVEAALPSAPGQMWHAVRVDPDLVLVSRYPIKQSFSIPGGFANDANAAFVLDMQEPWGTDLLLLSAHPPCCRNDDARQRDLDAMMAFVRDAKADGGLLDLDPETPIIILGDMNLVGLARQLNTLLTGEIVNTGAFGPAFAPDWDGSALADLRPPHVALPMTFTWYNESSAFHPGRLDFLVYTDSVLEPGSRFVLFTLAMHPDSLAAHGLAAADATIASDHLPVVGDFRYRPSTGTAADAAETRLPDAYRLAPNYPNPFHATTRITFALPVQTHARLTVFDALGREVAVLIDGVKPPGQHAVSWDARTLPSGTYFYRLEAGGRFLTRTLLLLR